MVCFDLCFVMPTWVMAESFQELLHTLNGKVIAIAGSRQYDSMRKPYLVLNFKDSFHQFEYAMSSSELRAVTKGCSQSNMLEPAELRARLN